MFFFQTKTVGDPYCRFYGTNKGFANFLTKNILFDLFCSSNGRFQIIYLLKHLVSQITTCSFIFTTICFSTLRATNDEPTPHDTNAIVGGTGGR